MATQYSNKPIVTNGLVYALDFGNQKSYVSGSSSARSLVFNPTPATFQTVPAGDYPGLSVAYSVRRVVSGYTGSAMMIQSGSVSQSIGFDSNGNLDTAAIASFAGSGTATVKIWYDQSGNNNHASQSTVSNQPFIYITGSITTLGSKPTLMYSSSGYSSLTISNPLTDVRSVFWAINPQKGTGGAEAFLLGDSATYDFHGANNAYISAAYARAEVINAPFYINSQLTSSTVSRPVESFNTFQILSIHPTVNVRASTISQDRFGVYGARSLTSGVSEVLIYNTSQTSSRPLIEENINSYFAIYSSLVGSPIPGFTPGLLNFQSPDALITNQTFTGFSYDRGNSTVMYVGETKGTSSLFTQDTSLSVITTTSSVGFGSTSNNLGRTYPVSGLKHVTLRFSSGSVDCFVNGIPVPANSVFPTGSSVAGGKFAIPVYTGSLGLFQVYNRPLTGDEIWNNYQLTAPRYGLGAVQNKPYTLDDNAYLFLSQSGITDPIITSSINTFVLGLKSASLWDKMIAIYPFVGTGSVGVNLTGSHRWNLKEPSLVTYPLSFTGSWNGSVSGSTPSGSNTNITAGGTTPSTYYPNYSSSNAHISILSYDTPTSSSFLAGTGIDTETAATTLAGDYGTPAAAYSVRKVRTAYSGALMDVRRDYDNTTGSIGYISNGDLDTGSLLDFVVAGRAVLPGAYSGLAAAYSLRRVSASYAGPAIDVRRSYDDVTGSIGFDANGNLNTASLAAFVSRGNNLMLQSENFSSYPMYVGSLTASATTAPDNTLTATKLNGVAGNTSNWLSWLAPNTSGIQNGTYTYSIFAKKAEKRYLHMLPFTGSYSNVTTWFDLDLGSLGTVATGMTASIQSVGNGWYRCNLTYTGLVSYFDLGGSFVNNDRGGSGLSTDGIFIWGSQLNSGSVALPYVKTVGTAKTNESGSFDTVSTGWVAQWYDQSGNNRHATQTATGSQPLIVSSGSLITLNNKPSISFVGNTNESLSVLNSTSYFKFLHDGTNSSIVNVGSVGSTSNPGFETSFISTSGGSSTVGIFIYYDDLGENNTIAVQVNRGIGGSPAVLNTSSNDSYIPNSQNLLFAQFDADNATSSNRSIININNNSDIKNNTYSDAPSTNDSTNDFTIGGSIFSNYVGKQQEILIYSSSQAANRPLIENNINNYYSIYTGSNNGFVERWYDQSGNNRHLTRNRSVSNTNPKVVISGSLLLDQGRPYIQFESEGNYSLAGSTAIDVTTTNSSFFIVYKKTTSSDVAAFGGLNGNNYMWLDYGSQQYLKTGGSVTYTIPTGSLKLISSIRSYNGDASLYVDNNLTGSISSGTTTVQFKDIMFSLTNDKPYTSEIVVYASNQTSNREAMSYGINNYYNIYTQPSASFTTSSFTIKATPTGITGAINNQPLNGISSTGPVGFITVSRTGSNALTIARNGVTSSFTVPASGALSTGIYLGASNYNGITVGSSPLGISFASVGVGLNNSEVRTLNTLTQQLQSNLGRASLLDYYPSPILAAYSVRKLKSTYTGSALRVRRTSDNAQQDIGFVGNNLDTGALTSFVGSASGYVTVWYDQSGNNSHISQSTAASQPLIVTSGSVVNAKTFETLTTSTYGLNNNNTLPAVYFNGFNSLALGRNLGSITEASYYTVFNLAMNSTNDGYIIFSTNTKGESSGWKYSGYADGLIAVFHPDNSSRRNFFPANVPTGGTALWSGFHTGSAMTVFINNTSKGTNNVVNFSSGSLFTVGSGVTGDLGAPTNWLRGSIQELVLFSTSQTGSRVGIETNINSYFNIY